MKLLKTVHLTFDNSNSNILRGFSTTNGQFIRSENQWELSCLDLYFDHLFKPRVHLFCDSLQNPIRNNIFYKNGKISSAVSINVWELWEITSFSERGATQKITFKDWSFYFTTYIYLEKRSMSLFLKRLQCFRVDLG